VAVALSTYKANPVYTWNPATRAYSSGKNALSQAEVRGYVDAAIQSARGEARRIAEAFLKHGNSAAFETELKALLKNLHLSSSMVANGGRDQMTPQLWGRAGSVLKSQFSYLEDFGRQLDRGEINLGPGFLSRAESYASFGSQVYENFVRDGMIDAGMTEAFNNLGSSANSCLECPSLEAAGWMPIEDMPEIGERECSVGCNCSIQYR
jgi:hypothetical protein